MKVLHGIHEALQVAIVVLGLLVAVSELADWPTATTLSFGLVGALAGLASYFTGKRVEAASDLKIQSLEMEQAGRLVSDALLETIVSSLSAVSKQSITLELSGLQGNRESIVLANRLKPAFERAGFIVNGVWEDVLLGGTGPGILIRQESAEGTIGLAIQAALQSVGLDSRIVELRESAANKVEVIVAYKP